MMASGVAFTYLCLQVVRQSVSSCGTRKLLVRLEDGLEVETVVIPNLNGKRCVDCKLLCRGSMVPNTGTIITTL